MHTEANTSRSQSHLLRLAPRIVDLAIHDIDVNVRINALHLVGRLEKVGAFDEDTEQRAKIATLIYASEPKIRKAASAFFTSLWMARAADLKAEGGKKRHNKKKAVDDQKLEQRFRYKALAAILLQTAQEVEPHASLDQTRIAARASAAVGALWDEVEELQNWEELTEYLLLDHNDGSADGLLQEDEEGMLLGVLVAAVKHDERVRQRQR
jgi:cohesin complex subunit SA-1/2